MKVKLTEQQFKNIIKRELDEMICLLGEGVTSKDIKNQQNLIMQKMQNAYKENKPLYNQDGSVVDDGNGGQVHFADRMSDIGRHIGVTNGEDMNDIQWEIPVNKTQTNNTAQKDFGDYIYNLVKVAQAMRTNNVVKAAGTVDDNIYFPYNTKTNNSQSNKDVEGYKGSFMMRCRNALDLLGLNWLYMPASVWEKNANKKTLGVAVEIKNDYLKKAEEIITPEDYKTHEDDVDYIFRLVDENDSEEMCNLAYNKIYAFLTSESQQNQWYGGSRVGQFEDQSAITTAFFKQQTNKLFEQVYGIHLDIPSETFTLGNHKLGPDTLIINFASAHQCPAWNQCLVKNSCYAKSIENVRPLAYGKNKKMTMMWEASRYDNEILDALKTLIRLYVVNIAQMRKYIKQPTDNVSYDYGQVAEAKSDGEDYCLSLIRAGFDKMSQEQLDIIKNTKYTKGDKKHKVGDPLIKRANYVRLNEAGDFIGQWLVDAMDEFAGELKLIDVTVAAYTCRNLNYNGIKNIIINASLSNIGGNVARRFYAVPEDIYNSLDDTYAASESDVKYDENGMPDSTKVTHPIIVNGAVIPYPQPMYDENGNFMNAYYYKCPCGRGKEDMGDNSANTKYYFNHVEGTTEKGGVGCYQCNMCYQPKNSISDKPINVYVQVHSVESDMFDFKQQKDFGTSKDYKQKRSIFKPNNQVNEAVEYDDDNQNLAIQQITNNAIQSVNEHLTGLAQQKLEEERIKKDFFDTLRKLM